MADRKAELILKADDYGDMPAANEAVNALVEQGLLTNIGVMTNIARQENADDLIRAIESSPDPDLIGIVLHTNFQTGRPVSDPEKVASLLDGDGFFKRPEPANAAWEEHARGIDPAEAEIELDAQINRFQDLFGRLPDALDSHNIILAVHPVAELAIKKAVELKLAITYPYLYADEYDGVLAAQALHTALQQEYKVHQVPTADRAYPVYFNASPDPEKAMIQAIDSLQPGVTQIVFHPVHPKFKNIPTDSDERYRRRLTDYHILTNPNVVSRINHLRSAGRLTSYKKLRQQKYN
jgi:predicted glycoside hydrolase/deacetylase ChbG (UPF0249 family)